MENLPRSATPPKVTNRAESRLLRLVRENRGRSLRYITHDFTCNTEYAVNVHHNTVKKYCTKQYVWQVIRKKMVVREVNRRKRLSWCLARRNLSVQNEWKQVIFSDESQIVIGQNNVCVMIRKWSLPSNMHVSFISEANDGNGMGLHIVALCWNCMHRT